MIKRRIFPLTEAERVNEMLHESGALDALVKISAPLSFGDKGVVDDDIHKIHFETDDYFEEP